MCKCWFILLLFGLMTVSKTLEGQSVDSLLRVVNGMQEDTQKVMTYRQIFRAYYAADQPEPMLDIAEKGLLLSQKLHFDKGIDLFIFYKASSLDILGRGKEAIPLFEEGLRLADQRNDPPVAADYHINLGSAFHGLGDLDKGLFHFLAAYDIYKKLNDLESLSKLLNNIGIVYRTQNNYERAEDIYRQSLTIKQQLNDSLGMATSWQNLGLLLSYGKDDRKAEAIEHLKTAMDLYRQLGQTDDVAGCQSNLGQIYFNFRDYRNAQIMLAAAQKRFDTHPSVEYGAVNYHLLGVLATMDNHHHQAEQYFQKGLTMARQMGHRERIWPLLEALSQTQHLLGNDAGAYASLQEAGAFKDSITEEKKLSLLQEMQTRFDVTQKDNLLKINQLELAQRTRQRNWLLTAALFLATLAAMIFFGLRHRIRLNKTIAAQEAAIQSQTIRQLEQENQLTALTAMIEGQEQERSRIANDLHDGLGGLLTSVKSHFNALDQPSGEAPLFQKTNRLIDDACGEVRRIAHNMMPRALAISGLNGALEDLASDLQKSGIQCELEIEDAPLSPTQAVTTYRIIQELTHNVLKHAGADHLLIQLLRRDRQITIIVEDNGKGFDLARAHSQKGLGLSSIESRVKFLQGSIEWDSVPNEGTTVVIRYEL